MPSELICKQSTKQCYEQLEYNLDMPKIEGPMWVRAWMCRFDPRNSRTQHFSCQMANCERTTLSPEYFLKKCSQGSFHQTLTILYIIHTEAGWSLSKQPIQPPAWILEFMKELCKTSVFILKYDRTQKLISDDQEILVTIYLP